MSRRIIRLLIALVAVSAVVFATQKITGTQYFSLVTVEAPQDLTMTFLQKATGDRRSCDATSETTVGIALAKCPECKIVRRECLNDLSPELGTLLNDSPIATPSARIRNGTITFKHPNPDIALAICKEGEKQAATNPQILFTCDPPNQLRPIPAKYRGEDDRPKFWQD